MAALLLAAAALLGAASSCALAPKGKPAILLGQEWESAVPRLDAWAASGSAASTRSYDAQSIESKYIREFPPLDSLLLAEVYRRSGVDDARFRRFPPAPSDEGRLCRESYIFYLRGNRIAGVEYRAVVSNGLGSYRQEDDAVGEIPGAILTGT